MFTSNDSTVMDHHNITVLTQLFAFSYTIRRVAKPRDNIMLPTLFCGYMRIQKANTFIANPKPSGMLFNTYIGTFIPDIPVQEAETNSCFN